MGATETLRLRFLGAVGTVTGSKTEISYRGKKYLIDCGLFQGPKAMRERNWQFFAEAEQYAAVILTHAHIDHSGYLPKLVREGFSGPIYCSRATADLCRIMLRDAAHLMEEDARYADRTRHSRHFPARPLFDQNDAEKAIGQLRPSTDDAWHALQEGLSFRMLRSGHILGSRFVQVSFARAQGSEILTFSGDIGNGRSQVLKGPVPILETDELVLETTYGDRLQSRKDPADELAGLIHRVVQRRGVVVIPAFSVGRTQELLYLIRKLESDHKIPEVAVYLDSPMALSATDLYLKYGEELLLTERDGFLETPFSPRDYIAVESPDESMMLCMKEGPFVVLSAAGMLTGGRILHHLKARLPDPRNAVVFVGYQAEGTKGRLLQQGIGDLRIHHTPVNVEAEIITLNSLSAHADYWDVMQWLSHFKKAPRRIFLNHGEPSSTDCMRYRLQHELTQTEVIIPQMGEAYHL